MQCQTDLREPDLGIAAPSSMTDLLNFSQTLGSQVRVPSPLFTAISPPELALFWRIRSVKLWHLSHVWPTWACHAPGCQAVGSAPHIPWLVCGLSIITVFARACPPVEALPPLTDLNSPGLPDWRKCSPSPMPGFCIIRQGLWSQYGEAVSSSSKAGLCLTGQALGSNTNNILFPSYLAGFSKTGQFLRS